MAESEAEGGRRVRDGDVNPLLLPFSSFRYQQDPSWGGGGGWNGGGDGAKGGEIVSLAGPSRGMLLVSRQGHPVEKQYGVQLRPIPRCWAGPAALGSAWGGRLLPGAVHGGREGDPAPGAGLDFLCRNRVQHDQLGPGTGWLPRRAGCQSCVGETGEFQQLRSREPGLCP